MGSILKSIARKNRTHPKSPFIKLQKETKPYTKNIFTRPLGDKYAKKLYDVYNANLETRDSLMSALYNESKEDENLTPQQKRIIAGCYIGYETAIGRKNVAVPLVDFLMKSKPNLTKLLNPHRFKRVVADLYTFVEKTGFEYDCYNLIDLLERFLKLFTKGENKETDNELTFHLYLVIAISKYASVIPAFGYSNMWFILMLLKNISLLSYVNINLLKDDILDEVKNLVRLINIVHSLELQRAGIKKKTEVEKKEEEQGVFLPQEEVSVNDNKFIENEKYPEEENDSNKIDEDNDVLDPESSYSPVIDNMDQLKEEK